MCSKVHILQQHMNVISAWILVKFCRGHARPSVHLSFTVDGLAGRGTRNAACPWFIAS